MLCCTYPPLAEDITHSLPAWHTLAANRLRSLYTIVGCKKGALWHSTAAHSFFPSLWPQSSPVRGRTTQKCHCPLSVAALGSSPSPQKARRPPARRTARRQLPTARMPPPNQGAPWQRENEKCTCIRTCFTSKRLKAPHATREIQMKRASGQGAEGGAGSNGGTGTKRSKPRGTAHFHP